MKEKIITVEREYKIKVWFDKNVWTDKEIKNWNDTFYDAKNIDDILEHVIEVILNSGKGTFVDGIGYVSVNSEYPYGVDEDQKCNSIKLEFDNISTIYF